MKRKHLLIAFVLMLAIWFMFTRGHLFKTTDGQEKSNVDIKAKLDDPPQSPPIIPPPTRA